MTDSMAEIVDLPSAERQARQPRARYGERALIVCDNLVKIYKVADLEVVALQGLDLLVESGEFIALVGASGSGKSTLLNVLGGLDVPSAGRAIVAGYQLAELGPREQTRYLRQVIGFVWQQTGRNLLPYLSALENVALPMAFDGVPADIRATRARELLRQVGLEERVDHRPQHLSGGEQQRVAIAVALANEPEVILADEPTGELDSGSAAEIFELLRRLNRELGVTIVVATHDPLVSSQVSRTVSIRDGRVSSEVLRHRSGPSEEDHHIETEFAVLDRVGRLQLPRAHVEALGLEKRVRVDLEEDHISVWPDRSGGAGRRAAAAPRSPRGSRGCAMTEKAPMIETGPMVETRGLGRDFTVGPVVVHALRDVNLAVDRGELVAVRGRSGSGKTTLLSLIGGLDRATSGDVVIDGRSVGDMTPDALVELRRRKIGFIFQAFGLLSILSAEENVEVPLRLVKAAPAEREERVAVLLELVGLGAARAASPARAVGGRAAAGGDRAGPRQPAGPPARRRADRSARLRDRPLDHEPAARGRAQRGRDGDHRHARSDAHRPRRPGDRYQRRPGRGRSRLSDPPPKPPAAVPPARVSPTFGRRRGP